MIDDLRKDVTEFYDLDPGKPEKDIEFYKELISDENIKILELGCGTGRVFIPLSYCCKFICGIDLSSSMINICKKKIKENNINREKGIVNLGDITDFNLNEKFDFIIAPFRVIQNLETDKQVEGLFKCVSKHLTERGTVVLNVFNPYLNKEDMATKWCSDEKLDWEIPFGDGKIACYEKKAEINSEKQILYPELIYRKYGEKGLEKESVHKLIMRYYYPDEFKNLIINQGFEIINKWGGYSGEKYGKGPELVIHFRKK